MVVSHFKWVIQRTTGWAKQEDSGELHSLGGGGEGEER